MCDSMVAVAANALVIKIMNNYMIHYHIQINLLENHFYFTNMIRNDLGL